MCSHDGTHVELNGGHTGVDTSHDLLGDADGVDIVLVQTVGELGKTGSDLWNC